MCSSRKSTSGSLLKMGSMSLPLPTPRVRVLKMVGSLEPTSSTKRSLSGLPSPSNNPIPLRTEKKIVMGSMKKYGEVDEEFATNLVTWAEVIRKTFYDGGVDEIISTRRLDHIVKPFTIFKDKMTAIEMCVARFDEDTKESFIDLYTKVDAGVMTSEDTEEKVEEGLKTSF